MKEKIFSCESREEPVWPHCGELPRYWDRRQRFMKWYNGEKKAVLLREGRCARCNCLHNELPDLFVPHKHYVAEIIEKVVDDVSSPGDL